MKNIALILGAFAGVGNRANATPVPDFNAGEGQGFHQTGVVSQKKDYKMPVEPDRSNPSQIFGNSYGSSQYPPMGPPYNHQDLGNFNQYWPGQDQPSAYSSQYWPGQVYKQQPRNKAPVSDQAPDPNQSLNLNSQKDQPEYKQPSSQDRVFETSNTEPAENSEVIDSEVIDSEVIDSEVIDSEVIDSEVIDSELINTELINSELIDSELIDAVVVFDKFDCDLHEMPSVEDAQKKIQKYFFNSAYRFNGLNSIKILKREGRREKTRNNIKSECDRMIVHYQASVLKSRSRTPEFFKEINIRIGLSFEDEYHSFGEKNEFDQLYAFKISDFMNGLIDNLGEYIDEDVQNMIIANDYDVRTEHRRMEFSKLKKLIGDEDITEDITEDRWKAPFTLFGAFDGKPIKPITDDDRRRHSDKLEANLFKLKNEFKVKKTRDERKKDERMDNLCKIEVGDEIVPDETLVTLPDGTSITLPERTLVTPLLATINTATGEEEFELREGDMILPDERRVRSKQCNRKDVFIKTTPISPTNNDAIDDLLTVLGEEEFMNKFIGIGNKKIATEIAQDKSDKEKKMKAAQYAIWKFVEDKTAREAEDEADLPPVAQEHVDDLQKLIDELTEKKNKIYKAQNEPEVKNRWKNSMEFFENQEEKVKDLTEKYTDNYRKKEIENEANENLGLWLGINGRPVQNKFWNWEWSG